MKPIHKLILLSSIYIIGNYILISLLLGLRYRIADLEFITHQSIFEMIAGVVYLLLMFGYPILFWYYTVHIKQYVTRELFKNILFYTILISSILFAIFFIMTYTFLHALSIF